VGSGLRTSTVGGRFRRVDCDEGDCGAEIARRSAEGSNPSTGFLRRTIREQWMLAWDLNEGSRSTERSEVTVFP